MLLWATAEQCCAAHSRCINHPPAIILKHYSCAAATLLTGSELTHTEAHGKHLFLGFRDTDWIHIHLGLFG